MKRKNSLGNIRFSEKTFLTEMLDTLLKGMVRWKPKILLAQEEK
jgi:hypothetical protein